jgi:MFS family permease
MVVPILPFFIKELGGGGVAIGLIFGIGDAVASLMRVFSGYFADKSKRYKLIVFLGYLFSSVAKFAYPLALKWPHIGVIRPIERIGKGVRDAPRDAIVSESVPESRRGRAFGIQRAMDSTGAIIGSVAVLVLFVVFDFSFSHIFYTSAFIGLLAIIPILFVKVPADLRLSKGLVSFSKVSAKAWRFIAIATVFAMANFSYAFFVLRAESFFPGLDAKKALGLTLLVYIFFNIFDAAFSGPAGALSDKFGRRRTILIGYTIFSLVCLGFLLAAVMPSSLGANFTLLAVLFAGYGLFKAFIDASQRAFVADLSPDEIRGTALGTFETATGLAAIPSGLIAGLLWNVAPVYTFAYGLALSLVAVIALGLAVRHK